MQLHKSRWRPVNAGLLRCVGTWVQFRHLHHADVDLTMKWFVQRVHRAFAGRVVVPAAPAPAGGHKEAAQITAASAKAAPAGARAAVPDEAWDKDGAWDKDRVPDADKERYKEQEEEEEEGEKEQGRRRMPVKRKQPVRKGPRADTKQARREEREARQWSGVFLVVMNSQGRRRLQLVMRTLEWRPTTRPAPCLFTDADMAADLVQPVEPIWDRAMYVCPHERCHKPSYYEDLCPHHTAEILSCRVGASALGGLGIFATKDLHPLAPESSGAAKLLFPFGGMYHLEQDMHRYMQLPTVPAPVRDYLMTVPGAGVCIDGCTCRSTGSMLNHADKSKANCEFVNETNTFRNEAAVFVACIKPIRTGEEMLVCYNHPDWTCALAP